MKISRILIENFRGIRRIELNNLGTIVIVAGQNGSGKSCIFDAIKLVKSVYGGYHQAEYQQWIGEFQLDNRGQGADFGRILNDQGKKLLIECCFEFSPREIAFLKREGLHLLEQQIWREIFPEAYNWSSSGFASLSPNVRHRENEVKKRALEEFPGLLEELEAGAVIAKVEISSNGDRSVKQSRLLQTVFSTYLPESVGVIDYHGAHRTYGREAINGVNLDISTNHQNRKQTALSNYSAKYANVKSEMASAYVKDAISRLSGHNLGESDSLTVTLKELFKTFFPDKEFEGPQPTEKGGLIFPVKVAGRFVHDLDELSSGEKEVLYGYLRIRNSAPRDSIVLLDEPELHLNPRLIRELPRFYRKHIGEALGNQIFLISHSDALLREVVGQPGYQAFHMIPLSASDDLNQIVELSATEDFERVVIDLVGDLPSYLPAARFLILEGSLDSEFDKKVVTRIFPEVAVRLNLICGTDKTKVIALKALLSAANLKGRLGMTFFSVTDRDSDSGKSDPSSGHFVWDRYHIENYLLEPVYIAMALNRIQLSGNWASDSVLELLKVCAKSVVDTAIRAEVLRKVNALLVGQIDFGFSPSVDIVDGISQAVERSFNRIQAVCQSSLNRDDVFELVSTARSRVEESFETGDWTKEIPGRLILREFTNRLGGKINYEILRNLIVSEMSMSNFKPTGMSEVLDQVLAR